MSEWTECDEIAENLPLPAIPTWEAARQIVRAYMPDETMTITDNATEALLDRAKAAHRQAMERLP